MSRECTYARYATQNVCYVYKLGSQLYSRRMGGLFSFVRRLFGRRDEDRAMSVPKSDANTTSSDALDEVVNVYLKNDMVNIPLLPDFVEKRIYKMILEVGLQFAKDALHRQQNFTVLKHSVQFEISPQLCEGIRDSKAKVDRDARLRKRHQQIIRSYVEKFVQNDDVNTWLLPEFVEKRLYANVIQLVVGVLQDTLHTSHLSFIGHRVTFNMSPMKEDPASAARKTLQNDETEVNLDTIDRMVEAKMKDHNIFLLPDTIERHLYRRAFRILLGVATEIMDSFELTVFNHTVKLKLAAPSTVPS